MQFIYHPEAGEANLIVEGESFLHLFKSRRHKEGEKLLFRNLKDCYLFTYLVERVEKRKAFLKLVFLECKEVLPKREVTLIWCVVDPKVVEKTLPSLNEIGIWRVVFVYCERSQRNFKLKLDRLKKILINSSQQCGRSKLMEIEIETSLKKVLKRFPNTVLIDFCDTPLNSDGKLTSFCIGAEGGLVESERGLFKEIKGLDTPLVLKSETAAVAVSAKILL
ncbi:MAG: 16S rRNA (uracil(1498)-N(3))-methyltransferase [Epsilonproteobacteria bacterium]|nr:16S rRNA (uracil(1498)-N(3))-methyltransferase [Campylobacterota bacterium]